PPRRFPNFFRENPGFLNRVIPLKTGGAGRSACYIPPPGPGVVQGGAGASKSPRTAAPRSRSRRWGCRIPPSRESTQSQPIQTTLQTNHTGILSLGSPNTQADTDEDKDPSDL